MIALRSAMEHHGVQHGGSMRENVDFNLLAKVDIGY